MKLGELLTDEEWRQREAGTTRKYANKKLRIDGLVFDSRREYRRWHSLTLLQRQGEISDLQRQVPYVLAPAVRMGASQRLKPAIRLIVDFQYRDRSGALVLEDVKGVVTDVFRLKAHLLKAQTGLEVRITK